MYKKYTFILQHYKTDEFDMLACAKKKHKKKEAG